MSSISLPRVLAPRRGNSLDTERENFEKIQTLSISKAVNSQENPVKEKHLRNAIIGTFQEKGGATFWSVVTKLPLQGNPIVCWKFCHSLHKLLREGHPNIISESLKYKSEIEGLGRLWGHLKEGYGKLISCYTKLLNVKLDFHRKNPRFPGNLQLKDDQLHDIGEGDVNNYFQLAVEMFDYMDEILNLQTAIFGSLDMSRSNSMTSTGQCRLAPLICCIQDSSQLYGYSVKILFRLHSNLPPDTLIGHSDRFHHQFNLLRQFYYNSSTLQYFKHLIHIPLLPDNPPNFLVQTDLSSHLSPVVILPPRPDTPDNDSVDMMLVETLSTTEESFPSNGSVSPEQLAYKEQLIDQLLRDSEDLKMEIQKTRADDELIIANLQGHISNLQLLSDDLREKLQLAEQQTESLQVELAETVQHADTAAKLSDTEKKSKVNEEKYLKMREVYNKLREEHISLLRNKADVDKQLTARLSDDSHQIAAVTKLNSDLEKENESIQQQLLFLATEKESLDDQIRSIDSAKRNVEGRLAAVQRQHEEAIEAFRLQRSTTFANVIEEVMRLLQNTLEDVDNASFAFLTCTPEYFVSGIDCAEEKLDKLAAAHQERVNSTSKEGDWDNLLRTIVAFGYVIGQELLHGKGTATASPDVEQGEKLTLACRQTGLLTLQMFDNFKSKAADQSGESIAPVRESLEQMRALGGGLISKMDEIEDVSEMVENELHFMDKAIEEASARIEDLLRKTRQVDSGMKLEVNGKILDTCTALMQAIKVLVQRSKALQEEIVSQGKGAISLKEFYKKNHRWTEGLLSAAKTVGLGAKFLVNAADRVLNGKAKFEELMVASQEIAAGTAQLVVASKVKADRNSDNLKLLSRASKGVTEATGCVVATAKSCAELMEESDVMDFTSLSLHQAKRLEMESQVRVLELESQLAQERIKLAQLRKRHYTLAGPSEGWDQEDIPQ